MPKKIIYGITTLILLAIVGAFLFLISENQSDKKILEKKVWIKIEPIQCGGNPWEIDYHQKSNRMEHFRTQNSGEKGITIIKNYYDKKGIVILDGVMENFPDIAVCEACDCPDGYTLYLLIHAYDLTKMQEFGYVISKKIPK